MKCGSKIFALLALVAPLAGCGKSEGVTSLALAIGDSPNCPSGRDRFWAELYRQVEHSGVLPDSSEVDRAIRATSRSDAQATALVGAYSSIAREIRFLSPSEALIRLAQMEIGDRTTPEKSARQDEIESKMARALQESVSALGECSTPDPVVIPGDADSVVLFEGWRKARRPQLYGAYKAISVAYQSCNILSVPPLSKSSPSIEGVEIIGDHPNGVGLARVVSDRDAVYRTNPYYAGRVSPVSGCFHAGTTPLIYDYGGKPFASSSSGGVIDFFKDAGSGTEALGVDCSGFVAASVLAGGLRLKRNVSSKAPQSGGVNATMFSDPAKNGLSCFSRVASTPSANLQEGDLFANGGHIFMVDRVGSDPLGIAGAKTSADCAAVSS
jgi:hypothetical protein